MLALWWLGAPVEMVLGRARYLGLYFVSGLAGATGALIANPNSLTVGASGAIFGLLGAGLILEYQATGSLAGELPDPDRDQPGDQLRRPGHLGRRPHRRPGRRHRHHVRVHPRRAPVRPEDPAFDLGAIAASSGRSRSESPTSKCGAWPSRETNACASGASVAPRFGPRDACPVALPHPLRTAGAGTANEPSAFGATPIIRPQPVPPRRAAEASRGTRRSAVGLALEGRRGAGHGAFALERSLPSGGAPSTASVSAVGAPAQRARSAARAASLHLPRRMPGAPTCGSVGASAGTGQGKRAPRGHARECEGVRAWEADEECVSRSARVGDDHALASGATFGPGGRGRGQPLTRRPRASETRAGPVPTRSTPADAACHQERDRGNLHRLPAATTHSPRRRWPAGRGSSRARWTRIIRPKANASCESPAETSTTCSPLHPSRTQRG